MSSGDQDPELSPWSRANAREEVFIAIERHAPEIVQSLSDLSPDEWASRWFDGARWAARQASATKNAWKTRPDGEARGEFGVFPGALMRGRGTPIRSEFRYRHWRPWKERESDFRNRIRRAFEAHLADEVAAEKERGPIPFVPAARHIDRHAGWLVLYHFKRVPVRLLAAGEHQGPHAEKTTTHTVRKAIRALAETIGLDLRDPDPSGRPPRDDS